MKKPASFQIVTTIRQASTVLLVPSQLCEPMPSTPVVNCSSSP